MKGPHGEVDGAAVVDSKLFGEVIQRVKVVAGVKPFLVLPVAAFHLAVVTRRIRADEFVTITRRAAVNSKWVGKSFLLLEKRLVNANPLSVCTHSTCMPRRLNPAAIFSRKSA